MKIVFMGTPDFAVGTLQAIVEAGHDVAAVVTQPDKRKGRGKEIAMTPVKEKALEYGITVYQPEKVRDPEFIDILREINPDIMVVVAFGQILSKTILDLPKYGCINVHASILPKYRGAAPIQWAVIDGEKESGVTVQQMDEGVDTGDILKIVTTPLAADETGGSLFDRLAVIGAKALTDTLVEIENGTVKATPQQGEASHAGKLDKALGKIDFNKSAVQVERLIRGLNPWPSAYTYFNGKTLKIWKAEVTPCDDSYAPGTIYDVNKKSFSIACADGGIKVLELQLEGKKRMDTESFLRGTEVNEGISL